MSDKEQDSTREPQVSGEPVVDETEMEKALDEVSEINEDEENGAVINFGCPTVG